MRTLLKVTGGSGGGFRSEENGSCEAYEGAGARGGGGVFRI